MTAEWRDWFAQESHWMLPVFFTVLLTVIVGALSRAVLRRIKQRLAKTRTPWDEPALAAAEKPLLALIWVLGLNVACNLIASRTEAPLFEYADAVRAVLLIAIIAWFLLRFVSAVEATVVTPPGGGVPMADVTTARAVAKVLRISVLVTAALILLQRLGYSVSGVLAFGGIGGIAVGFAAKDLLANFFGGLMIFLDRPFSIGDWIRSPDRALEGEVEYIGWRLTRIRTSEQRPLYVPNSTFASIAVENVSRMTHRRIEQSVAVRYADRHRLPAIIEEIRAMLQAHPGIAQDQSITVGLDRFNESSLGLLVQAFSRSTEFAEFSRVRQDVFLKVLDILHAGGAAVAFPTRTMIAPDTAHEESGEHVVSVRPAAQGNERH
jgi:MscS family membrane protein